ncbi:MAG: virB8 family protein [Alphaproteobacteria bacterium]|jgi:type IV secretion system protein VirB8
MDSNLKDNLKEKAALKVFKRNWYRDKYEATVIQRNWLMIISTISLISLVTCIMLMIQISNSKTFEPFLIELDKNTNIITNVSNRTIEEFSAREVVRRSLIAQYVMNRESYQGRNYKYFYFTVVRLFSAIGVYRQFYFGLYSDPNSPLKLSDNLIREVSIKSITFLDKNLAQIRFKTNDIDVYSGTTVATSHYISTLTFDFFSKLEFTKDERYFNPLNFQVLSYTKEREDIAE